MIKRLATLMFLSSVICEMQREDPASFLIKTGKRLGDKGFSGKLGVGARFMAGSIPHDPELSLLLDIGEWPEAAELYQSRPRSFQWADRARLRTAVEETEVMHLPVPARVQTKSSKSRGELSVYHFLTSSIPYTQSGYTTRSHRILRAQQHIGISVRAATRSGYPVVVGKLPRTLREICDEVSYERLLPQRYRPTPLQRVDDAVALVVRGASEFGANVLHTTTDFHNAIVVSRAATKLGIPWVYEVRGELERTRISKLPPELAARGERSFQYRASRELETHYARSANAVVALSEVSRLSLLDRGVDDSRIYVVPNAIDQGVIREYADQKAARIELQLPLSRPIVGTITSVVGYEGLDDFLRALALLPVEVVGLIVGDGESLQELVLLARELGIKERVIFTGRQPNEAIDSWYAALDVFVMPRKNVLVAQTVTPIKALAAMAMRVPVVTSNLPALREVTGDFGYYSEPDSPTSLAHAISVALARGVPAKQERVDEWLEGRTWEKNASIYLELYSNLR